MQPIDFVISPKILRSFYAVLEPLVQFSEGPKETQNVSLKVNNQTLPLVYVDCQGIRLILPSSEPDFAGGTDHDVCVFQIEAIKLTPTAINPICRTPCRPDIYQNAAQSRILNIPGKFCTRSVVGMGGNFEND